MYCDHANNVTQLLQICQLHILYMHKYKSPFPLYWQPCEHTEPFTLFTPGIKMRLRP